MEQQTIRPVPYWMWAMLIGALIAMPIAAFAFAYVIIQDQNKIMEVYKDRAAAKSQAKQPINLFAEAKEIELNVEQTQELNSVKRTGWSWILVRLNEEILDGDRPIAILVPKRPDPYVLENYKFKRMGDMATIDVKGDNDSAALVLEGKRVIGHLKWDKVAYVVKPLGGVYQAVILVQ